MCFIKYIAVVNEKLKAQAKEFLLVWQNGIWKADFVLMHRLLWKHLQKKEDII